ncbi:FAD-dependent oxidoreductase [Endothiovibrio diazotrophicus]
MSTTAYRRWICDACGFVYDEEQGDPDSGLAPGTRFEEIPDDWMCPLCGLNKSELRLLPEAPAAAATPAAAPRAKGGAPSRGGDDYVVIVGAGVAGWSVAEAIRERDAARPVLLISSCPGASYPKPALSTAIAKGKGAAELVEEEAADKARRLGIEVRTLTRVIKLDPGRRRLTTAKGGIQYGQLVLALGAHQRKLPIQGDAAGEILHVNDLQAYARFREQLAGEVRHVTVLGAGLVGCEFAEDLTHGGYGVTVVDPAEYPLSSLVLADTGRELQRTLEGRGVEWRLGTALDRLERADGRLRATLADGSAFDTDLVLSAAGLVANHEVAAKAGVSVDNGIVTDVRMRTSAEGVYAIGDCAEVEGRIYAYIEPIRRQARTIAAELCGGEEPFLAVPPLVRVKTPSYPLTICPPSRREMGLLTQVQCDEEGRTDYLKGGEVVGFVYHGSQVGSATRYYTDTFLQPRHPEPTDGMAA